VSAPRRWIGVVANTIPGPHVSFLGPPPAGGRAGPGRRWPSELPGAGSIPTVTAPIIPGAEPWSSPGGSHGVLVLHGFTGNPQSMRPLAEALAKAGFTIDLPLLPGHGTSVEDLLPTRWEDWSQAAEDAFAGLAARCDKVAVAGLSVGGALTCWLAERHPEIAGIALVNPMIDPPSAETREMGRTLLAEGIETIDGVGSDIAKEGPVESAYPGLPQALGPVAGRGPGRHGGGPFHHHLPHPAAVQPGGPRGRPGVG
jgi:pimeloyl-ACP methyl ester carboxylesterase